MQSKVISLCCLMAAATLTALAQETPTEPATLNITLGEQRVNFAPTRSFQEMRLDIVNSLGETVFTHTTTEAEFDWDLRAASNENLAPGLYRYALTLKFSEEESRQHAGHFIVEKGRDQIWLTASDGVEVSGTTLSAARSAGLSLAGSRTSDDESVKRDVAGRETVDEQGNPLADKPENVRSAPTSLLGTAGRIAKFAAGGVSLIDSVVTEDAGGEIGIGTTTPGHKLHVEHGGGNGVLVKSTASFSVVDIDAFSGDAALRLARAGVNQWNIRNDPSTDDLQIFELGGGGSRMRIQNTTGNVGIGATSPNATLTVSANSNVPPSAPLGTVAYFANPNEANTFMTADAYGNTANWHSDFLFRRARGTMAVPLAVQTDDIVGQIQMRGYGATGFATSARAGIRLAAAENWNDTAQGAYLVFLTTPKLSNANNSERMRITDAGNVGIGTTAPAEKLHVIGNILATGTITPSDERYKQHIQTLSDALGKVQQLRGVSYDWRHDAYPQMGFNERPQLGFIAQELSQVLPEAVHQDAEGMYSVNYSSVVPVLVEAVKEQQAMIAQQQETMAQQQRMMARMQERLLTLEETRKPAAR